MSHWCKSAYLLKWNFQFIQKYTKILPKRLRDELHWTLRCKPIVAKWVIKFCWTVPKPLKWKSQTWEPVLQILPMLRDCPLFLPQFVFVFITIDLCLDLLSITVTRQCQFVQACLYLGVTYSPFWHFSEPAKVSTWCGLIDFLVLRKTNSFFHTISRYQNIKSPLVFLELDWISANGN